MRSERQKVLDRMEKITGIKTVKKKTLTPKQLKKKYEHVVRDLIRIRDGQVCQIQGRFHACDGPLVADHRPIKRGQSNKCFFDIRNLTLICNKANGMAENHPVIQDAILEVVKRREGPEILEILYKQKKDNFKLTEEYVLGVIEELKKKLVGGQDA